MPASHLDQWVWRTWLGWTLGLLLAIVAAMVGDAIGAGESQTLIGVGMGAGVGLLQGRAIRGIISNAKAWTCSSVVGLAAPFLVFDLSRSAGWQLPFSLYISVALGGLGAGVWQSILMRPMVRRAWIWVLGSIAGWSLASASAAVADLLPRALSLRGLASAAAYLAAVVAGGLILGLVTGLVLVRLDRRPVAPMFALPKPCSVTEPTCIRTLHPTSEVSSSEPPAHGSLARTSVRAESVSAR